jgi:hypothetical protein
MNLLLRYASTMRLHIFGVGLLALVLFAPCAVRAQQMRAIAVTISVTDPMGTGIADARIIWGVHTQFAILNTDEHGHASLNLLTGDNSISVSAPGYLSTELHIDPASVGDAVGGIKNVTVVLQPEPVQDPDEYAVWSTLLTKKYATEIVKELVIEDRTALLKSDTFVIKHLPYFEITSQALSDFKDKNLAQYAVENKFSVNVPCTLISKGTENGLFHFPSDNRIDSEAVKKIQDGWQQFRQDHPDARGIITISRVGFNSDKSLAVVYVATRAGMMMANGRCFLLVKKNGSWEIVKEEIIWFS